jgi:TonB family protein
VNVRGRELSAQSISLIPAMPRRHQVLNGRISSIASVAYSGHAELEKASERSVKQMKESHVVSASAAKSQLNEPGTREPCAYRLVIRAEIIPEGAPQTTVQSHWNKRALALVVGGLAVLLTLVWVGISGFGTDSASTSVAREGAQDVEMQSSPPVSASSKAAPAVPPPQAAPSTVQTAIPAPSATQPQSIESGTLSEPAASLSPINEVIPDVPRSALQTIRGTIRVTIRVTVDNQGKVVAATAEDPGPSRYFERLATEASKKWTFAPTDTQEQRRMLVRFNFTRQGTTAGANP